MRGRGVFAEFWWRDFPLQGAERPHSQWPEPSFVHIVGEGGIDNLRGDTSYELEPLAVFTDIEGATRFAAAQEEYNRAISIACSSPTAATETTVTMRTVPVGSLLN